MVAAGPAAVDHGTPAAALANSRRLGLEIWPRPVFIVGVLLLLSGLVMAAQAFAALGSSLSPLPAAKQGNRLICQGPYQRCRHPMYQAVLLCSLGVALAIGSLLHLLLLLGLVAVLGGKARREERSLLQLHPDYANVPVDNTGNCPWAPLARLAPLSVAEGTSCAEISPTF